jgi:hypothetical protein
VSRSTSRRLLATAAAATSVALLASACGKSSAQSGGAPVAGTSAATSAAPSASPSAAAPAAPQYAAGTPLISDGSATVTIGGTPVQFPTKVTEASWSPDGSRIAFIDGSGNVATARPDGSSVIVLVKPDQGSKFSTPSWQGGTVLYTEQNAAGTHFVRQAQSVGQIDHSDPDLYAITSVQTGTIKNLDNTSNPAGQVRATVVGTHSTVLFQTPGTKGPELWVHLQDSNSRGGANPAHPVGTGSWPAVSGSGEVAFVGSGGGIEVVSAAAMGKVYTAVPAATKVADAPDATHLTWTPDGASVAYSTPTGIMEVAAGQAGAAPTQLSAKPGVVSFLPAASDEVVTLAGTSPTDLVGASIAVSHRRWLTQTGTTPEPAGAGPTGPRAMSVTILAADDPAAAQKELSWAGLYGPTLLSTGQGASLDSRLTAEVTRVLGKTNTTDHFAGVDSVYLVGPATSFPVSVDAAITGLGYKPVHVTSAPKPSPGDPQAPLPPVAVVDPSDTAALNEAKADGAHVMSLSGGAISAADTAYLTGVAKNFQDSTPQIIAFGDKAFAAIAPLKLQRFTTPVEALGDTHADFLAATAAGSGNIAVVPAGSPTDYLLASLSAPRFSGQPFGASAVVTVDPAQGLSPTLKALLDTQSASIDELDLVDSASKLSADQVKQLGTLISGPLGAKAVANQTADELAKAEGVSVNG